MLSKFSNIMKTIVNNRLKYDKIDQILNFVFKKETLDLILNSK